MSPPRGWLLYQVFTERQVTRSLVRLKPDTTAMTASTGPAEADTATVRLKPDATKPDTTVTGAL
jgi:hypothetical protein